MFPSEVTTQKKGIIQKAKELLRPSTALWGRTEYPEKGRKWGREEVKRRKGKAKENLLLVTTKYCFGPLLNWENSFITVS